MPSDKVFSEKDIVHLAVALAAHLRRPLMSVKEVAREYRCSVSTVRRHLKRYDIPKRDLHGALHDGGNHPIVVSRSEWENKGRLSTRSVMREAA